MNQMNSGNLSREAIKRYLITKKVINRLFSSDFDKFIELEETQKKLEKKR